MVWEMFDKYEWALHLMMGPALSSPLVQLFSCSNCPVVNYYWRLMHPVLPSSYHWGQLCISTSEWGVCVCVYVETMDFTDLSEALKSLPSGLSSSWSPDLHLSIRADNLSYIISLLRPSASLCVYVGLWFYLISGKKKKKSSQANTGEGLSCWLGLWSECISDDFKHWCPLLIKDSSPPHLSSSLLLCSRPQKMQGEVLPLCVSHCFVDGNKIENWILLSMLHFVL